MSSEMEFDRLEAGLREALDAGSDAALDRVLGRVQAHGRSHALGAARGIRRPGVGRLVAIAVPAVAAAVLAGVVLSQVNRLKAVVPLPAASPSAPPSPSRVETRQVIGILSDGPKMGVGQLELLRGGRTAVMATVEGVTLNSTALKPRGKVALGNFATIYPVQGQMGARGLYYADGDGTIWVLPATGHPVRVTALAPSGAQHYESLAVSPDGAEIMATVFNMPQLKDRGDGLAQLAGPTLVDLVRATAGGTPTRIWRKSYQDYAPGTEVVGWDAGGPVMALDLHLGTQNVLGITGSAAAHMKHLDAAGSPTDSIGGADCLAIARSPEGPVACTSAKLDATDTPLATAPVTVRSETGSVLWTAPLQSGAAIWSAALSLDGGQLAVTTNVENVGYSARVFRRNGETVDLPLNFEPVDFIGSRFGNTVIGYDVTDPNAPVLETVDLARPALGVRFPVQGYYVGWAVLR